jgi:hypothetical protein
MLAFLDGRLVWIFGFFVKTFLFGCVVSGMQLRSSCLLGKHCITELHPSLKIFELFEIFNNKNMLQFESS